MSHQGYISVDVGGIGFEPFAIHPPGGPTLNGRYWRPAPAAETGGPIRGVVIINPATGVAARFYHAYARFLATHGLAVVTYDYGGIGESRPADLRGVRISWRDWGERDFDAVVGWVRRRHPRLAPMVVGHSIGGFLPGFAPRAAELGRILTIGAQYAYWRDYAAERRLGLFLKWHVAMPAITALVGHLPGRRLGWLEDLPAGVAYEWAFRRARMERNHPAADRPGILARFAAVRAPILAVGLTDDEYGTLDALDRALDYYAGARRARVMLSPIELGLDAVGHFDPFRAHHRDGLWTATLSWLLDGVNPWPWAAIRPPTTCLPAQDVAPQHRPTPYHGRGTAPVSIPQTPPEPPENRHSTEKNTAMSV